MFTADRYWTRKAVMKEAHWELPGHDWQTDLEVQSIE